MAIEDVKTIDVLRSLMNEGFKSANVRDSADRPETLYEAPIESEIGDPCIRTRYKYIDGAAGSSRKTIAYEEEVVAWPGYEAVQVGAGNDFNLLA